MSQSAAELVATEICKEFPTRGQPLRVLNGVSLELRAGENLAIQGPSGCGKSTLLHILGTLDAPTSGQVSLAGVNPFALPELRLAEFRNRRIGFVFQEHHLLPQLSVLENVLVPALAEGNPTADQVARARRLIDRVGLADRADHRPAELSGGERQRVAVARALLQRPALLLADEPTGSLDRSTARTVSKLLLDLPAEEGSMLVVVTHSQELAALMGRRVELNEGRLAPVGDTK